MLSNMSLTNETKFILKDIVFHVPGASITVALNREGINHKVRGLKQFLQKIK